MALQSAKDENNIVVTAYEVRVMALRRDCRIQHVIARKLGMGKKEEEEVSSYWIILRKREN